MYGMNFLLFLLVIFFFCKEFLEIYGGCMSYSIKFFNIYKYVEVRKFKNFKKKIVSKWL